MITLGSMGITIEVLNIYIYIRKRKRTNSMEMLILFVLTMRYSTEVVYNIEWWRLPLHL